MLSLSQISNQTMTAIKACLWLKLNEQRAI